MLEARGLRKSYGARSALGGVDLDIAAGEIVGLLGPNGAGKTTLVSILAGLIRPDAGSVTIGSIDALAHPRRIRPLLGLAPQETGLYPTLTCRENLRFFAELAGLRRRKLRIAMDEVAAALQLTDLMDRRAQHLSGGERRRLHTALALVNRPPLVLLDEPTTGADVQTRAHLLHFVGELAADGAAILYSTHYLTEIEQLGVSVVILDQGHVIVRGSVEELVAGHDTNVVELTFTGPVPPLRARWRAHRNRRLGATRAHRRARSGDRRHSRGPRSSGQRTAFPSHCPTKSRIRLPRIDRSALPAGDPERDVPCRLGGSWRSSATRCGSSAATRFLFSS